MPTTISGHPAATTSGDPRLAVGTIPGTDITLRTMRVALPLFLHVAAALDKEVEPLQKRNTWSYNYRPPRMGSGVSDHSGWAIDLWSDGIGMHTWPSRMPKAKAQKMGRILERYRTEDGRYVFGWGAANIAPGVDYKGKTYTKQSSNDPMHVFIAPGIDANDLREVIDRMNISATGGSKNPAPAPVIKPKPPVVVKPEPAPKPKPKPQPVLPVVSLEKLKFGASNKHVKLMQEALIKEGYKIEADGDYGPKTKDAVARFQRLLGFTGSDADGVIGETSLRKLAKRSGLFRV